LDRPYELPKNRVQKYTNTKLKKYKTKSTKIQKSQKRQNTKNLNMQKIQKCKNVKSTQKYKIKKTLGRQILVQKIKIE
jgi:hypothetical protein